jgi:hypothetical protein
MVQRLPRRRPVRLPWAAFLIGQLVLSLTGWFFVSPSPGAAAVIEIFPPATFSCNEQFETVANSLKPGDELVLHGGTYSQDCYRAITVNGTAAQPIIIRAATGEKPVITRSTAASQQQNNLDIANSSYLTIRGLTFRGGDGGVRIISSHHVTIEDCEIYETLNNALRANTGNSDALILRRNHIHHTGSHTTRSTEGEGIYLGCHDGSCRVTNSLIESNYIHHLRTTSTGGNDGIEVKYGSSGNIIRDNVIHDTTIGTYRYPCIFVYGGGPAVNIVEGNSMWNCGEGIYAVSDAVVRNNIIVNADTGIASYSHAAVPQMRNLTIVNNTVYGGPQCVYLRWSAVTNGVFANNAIYCPGTTAMNAVSLSSPGLTIRANYLEGRISGATIDNLRFFAGGAAAAAFVNPGGFDFWPTATSLLLSKAEASFVPPQDFNANTRTAPSDVGAYERDAIATNPGWRIIASFKATRTQAPQIAPPAAPTNLVVR